MEQIQKQSGPLVEMCFKTLLKFDRWQPIQDYIKVEAIKPGRPDTSKFEFRIIRSSKLTIAKIVKSIKQ